MTELTNNSRNMRKSKEDRPNSLTNKTLFVAPSIDTIKTPRTMLPYPEFDITKYMRVFIGKRLRTIRQSKKMTLNDAAELMGLFPIQLRRFEMGQSQLKGDMLVKIAEVYNVEPFILDVNALLGKFQDQNIIRWVLGQYSTEYIFNAYQQYLKDTSKNPIDETYTQEDAAVYDKKKPQSLTADMSNVSSDDFQQYYNSLSTEDKIKVMNDVQQALRNAVVDDDK